MKLLVLGSILFVALVACAAPDPTVPEDRLQDIKDYIDQAIAKVRTEPDRTQEDIDQAIAEAHRPDRTQEEVIDLSPSVTDSSIHADVGDRVEVQVDISSFRDSCQNLKVRDPFGNVVAELAPKKIRNGDVEFLQFRGAFLAATDGDYLVELRPDSGNLSCGGVRVFAASAKVKWTVQPN